MVSRNAPCPCGSGKKYKRCCLRKEMPRKHEEPDVTEADFEAFREALVDTEELPARLAWAEFDFGVDLFDPVLDDFARLIEASKGKPRDQDLIVHAACGVQRHATDEVRARCADEVERRAAELKLRGDRIVEMALFALEDLDTDPANIGLLLRLYPRTIAQRLLDRDELIKREEAAFDPALREECRQATEAAPEAVERLAIRLDALGDGAVPYLEELEPENDPGAVLWPLIQLLAKRPTMRSARLLEIFLHHSDTAELREEVVRAMESMPGLAWPILLYRAAHPRAWDYERLDAYEVLARAGVHGAWKTMVAELAPGKRWKEPMSAGKVEAVAECLVKLGDRRSVGWVVQQIHEGGLSEATRAAVEEAFQVNGWWAEIEGALQDLRRGVRRLVREGEEFRDDVARTVSDEEAGSVEALNFRAGLVMEEWNRAYHEELEWLRPEDVHVQGPRETALMKAFADELQRSVAGRRMDGPALTQEFGERQEEWMLTPRADLGGRRPIAVIFEERAGLCPHRGHTEAYVRREIGRMLHAARVALDDGDRGRAERQVKVVLEIAPEQPFAKRLMKRLTSRG
jgi:hypothetical protein